MGTLNGLPVYKHTIDEFDSVTGVEFISLVDYPAIEVNWVAMSENAKRYNFNADKQIVTGPVMIPDLPIYRADDKIGEYYVMFDASEIEKIARKFMREQRTLGINYQHQDNSQVDSAVITEYWFITDKANDKSNGLGFNLPVGTWMATTYIADTGFWQKEVKSGNVRGYSIEGFLNMEMAKIQNKNNIKMDKVKMEAEIKTVDGQILYTPADSFAEGAEVFMVDGDGNQVPAADADYVLENGVTLTIVAGKITVVAEAPVAQVEAPKVEQAEVVKYALTPEDMQSIMDALAPAMKEMTDKIAALEVTVAELTAANADMKTAMSSMPGSKSLTVKDDKNVPAVKKNSLEHKMEVVARFAKYRK